MKKRWTSDRSYESDLTPLPRWKQRRARMIAWWRRSRDQRRNTCKNLKKAGRRGLTLAISVVGAILISYGVWSVHHPAGYVTAGLLLWAVQWNHGSEGSDG